ncbi:MAG: DNA polymerase II large subunit, partial [Nanoarchaeota archaeon]
LTENEIKRVWTELEHFHDRITNLQGMPTEVEALYLAERMPIQIAGDASEKIEVPNHKNLERVDTNFLRSGFCLIMAEGLAQKAKKGFRLYNHAKENGIKMSGFDWLEGYVELQDKINKGKSKSIDSVPPYIRDLVAGRPVFGHPSRSGGFRFRYGRGRVSGFSATSLHPATMAITDGFIATGTQLKIEKPTKGCVTTVCDSIDGPIIKLKNGSVKKVNSIEDAKKFYPNVKEIIYLGDILFPFSDLANRNSNLIKSGYVEEWWNLNLEKAGGKVDNYFNVNFGNALELSRKYKIPLYPKFIFFWTEISKEQFLNLIEWFKHSWVEDKLIFPFNKIDREKFGFGKRALELLGIEHEVTLENVVLKSVDAKALLVNLGINIDFKGRPEKAKLRKLTGSPNVLFPVGEEGGRLRSFQTACEIGNVKSDFPIYYCEKCQKETIYSVCENCDSKCKKMYYCYECDKKSFEFCKEHEKGVNYKRFSLDINHYFEKAKEKLGFIKNDIPSLIKGVRGTSSEEHKLENFAKGILRAKHNLQVNKDGTIRFDATELPLIYFKPKEILVGVEKLKKLGYTKDIYGKELMNDDQILELMPHDILLPDSPASFDEKAGDVFTNVSKFVDDLLVRFYGLESFYNIKNKEDLVGKLGVCMAPHNCAGVICRFIGFSDSLGLFASPYMHAAIRRDCDGDEAAIMLLGDVLLNFSKGFLPGHRGGTQDAPLVLNAKIDAGEVDDQILDLEMCNYYPLELYEKSEQRLHSSEVKNIPIVKTALKEEKDPFIGIGFTHDTSDFNKGITCSAYKLLATMQEKVEHQMKLAEKIRAVDHADTARLIIERHFIRDLKGNLRKFSMQEFRCVKCNEIVRRPPLSGICPKCGGKIIFTINEGGIKKYLEPALDLARSYNISDYLKQTIELVKRYIDSIFGKELEKQEKLEQWF